MRPPNSLRLSALKDLSKMWAKRGDYRDGREMVVGVIRCLQSEGPEAEANRQLHIG